MAAAQTEDDESRWNRAWDELLFSPRDLYPKGSQAYHDFREFYRKYRQFSKRERSAKEQRPKEEDRDRASAEQENALGLPTPYDQRYRVNFAVLSAKGPVMIKDEEFQEVKKALHLYEDFRQKEKFAKTLKIQSERAGLPIAQYRQEIIDAVRNHQITLVAGDTGCGKSTQVCQYLLSGGMRKIGCTQPRRIAAMSLCKRVAFETLNEYGSRIAYQIRFESSKTLATDVVFLTEGVLLRQLASDPLLMDYDVLIMDEVHERHIHADFLLGLLRELIAKRPELKLVLMSATINLELFSEAFPGAPVIRVPGRMYPVEVEFVPLPEDQLLYKDLAKPASAADAEATAAAPDVARPLPKAGGPLNPKPYLAIMQRIDEQFPQEERGDLLIFVSGMSDIMCLAEEMRGYAATTRRWIILPLHSALSVEDQEKVFDPVEEGVRKCIISTNIAETAITINGIRFVIDSGKVKEMGYDAETKMSSLQSFWISRASAEQRKGRAGRTGPGVCYRLYSQEIYAHLLAYSIPEIQRIPLESIILQMIAMGVRDPREFQYIERPSDDKLEASLFNLQQHQAVTGCRDGTYRLTPLGGMLAQLPVDIPVGKMLVLGSLFRILDPVLTMAAALTVQSPFVTRGNFDSTARHEFDSPHGDAFTLLNLFDQWIKVKTSKPRSSRSWCRAHSVEEQRMYEIAKLKGQFKDILLDNGLLASRADEDDDESGSDPRGFGQPSQRDRRRDIARKRRQLRLLQRERESSRKKRVLRFDDELAGQQQPPPADADSDAQQPPSQGQPQPGDSKNAKKADGAAAEEERDDETEVDIRELDFMLTHDLDQLSRDSARELSLHDINLLKVILASGLYPNIAVADELNSVRRDSDQLFHTRWKEFVILHPTSVFGSEAKQITLTDLLAYVSLLETNKPYAVNVTRCPALHTLLLFANTIDTTADCSRLAVDNWLEIELSSGKTGERLLLVIHQLRLLLQNFLHRKLASKRPRRRGRSGGGGGDNDGGTGEVREGEEEEIVPDELRDTLLAAAADEQQAAALPPPPNAPPTIVRIHRESRDHTIACDEDQLSGKLAEFLDTAISFKMGRIKPSEFHAMFFTVASKATEDQAQAANQAKDAMEELEAIRAREHADFESTKGGWRVNAYLRFGSLRQHKTIAAGFTGSHLRKHWKCETCGGSFIFALEDIAAHQAECGNKKGKEKADDDDDDNSAPKPAAATTDASGSGGGGLKESDSGWLCPVCQKRYDLTPIQILKHKKTHT